MNKHLSPEVEVPIEEENVSIFKDEERRIKCGQCRDICRDYIGILGTYDLLRTGDTTVCINCGQCADVCPVESIKEQPEYGMTAAEVMDPDKIVVVPTSPPVRTTLGEKFGMEEGSFAQEKMVALLRTLRVDYVLGTNFAADLTVVGEASELIDRITTGRHPLPQFTNYCPAWVEFAEIYYPDMLPHISTAKSPIGMQRPAIKTYFARKMGIDPKKIVNATATPYTAKKYETRRQEMKVTGEYLSEDDIRDTDYMTTTRELARQVRMKRINFSSLEDSDYGRLMDQGSGTGVIFGDTGGVIEAALKIAHEYIAGEQAPGVLYELTPIRGIEAVREASLQITDITVNVTVIYGTASLRRFPEGMRNGEKQYHFVEVMTCPSGCTDGGEQPRDKKFEGDVLRQKRIGNLYKRDGTMTVRLNHENEKIEVLYRGFYKEPLSELAGKMLRISYRDKRGQLGGKKIG